MRTNWQKITSLLLVFVMIFALSACSAENKDDVPGTGTDVVAQNGDTLGEGSKTFSVEVTDAEGTVTAFTVKTDEETVGAALLALGVIAGEDSQYGLYVKSVNGITADYDADQTWWSFYVDGEAAMAGVDLTEITEGSVYGFKVEK